MGFVTLADGTVVHASQLGRNPVLKMDFIKTYKRKNVTYSKYKYTHKDGKEQMVTYTTTVSDDFSEFYPKTI